MYYEMCKSPKLTILLLLNSIIIKGKNIKKTVHTNTQMEKVCSTFREEMAG